MSSFENRFTCGRFVGREDILEPLTGLIELPPIFTVGGSSLYRVDETTLAIKRFLSIPVDVAHRELQPKGKKHATTEAESPRVFFQTKGRGDRFGTFKAELIQSSKSREGLRITLPFSFFSRNLNQ